MNTVIENVTNPAKFRGPDGHGWICDQCKEVIQTAGDGWLQWILVPEEPGGPKIRDMSLVHHNRKGYASGCQFNEPLESQKDGGMIQDWSLDNFCGNADGLVHLLSFLARQGMPQDVVLEMVQRIYIPGYERARLQVKRAIAEGVFEPNLPPGFYWQSDINAVLEWAKQAEEG